MMPMLAWFKGRGLEDKDRAAAIERLIADSAPKEEYFLMIFFAVCMATFGLLIDNGSVIIGSMLIAPLLSPILGIAMGIVMSDAKLALRSAATVLRSVFVAVPSAAVVAVLFSRAAGAVGELNPEIVARLRPDAISAAIALAAGFAASYALVKPQLSATLPGVAISVALIPPLADTGLGVARLDLRMVVASFLLFLVNAVGIIAAALIVFAVLRLRQHQSVAERALAKADKDLGQEKS